MAHKILIVADVGPQRDQLEQYIGHALGYAVTTAGTGEAACLATQAGPFDLYLIQTTLPDLSGVETYMRLKTIHRAIEGVFWVADGELSESDADYLHFSVPKDRVLHDPLNDAASLTRLIIGILGPPVA